MNGNICCSICESSFTRWAFNKNGFDVYRCFGCQNSFVYPLLSPETIKQHYDLSYFKGNRQKFGYLDYVAEEPYQKDTFRSSVRDIELIVPSGAILDVGCATGSFLKLFGSKWRKYGVEISEELLKEVSLPPGISLWRGDFLQYPQEKAGLFDVITMWDVLDHVRDPAATLDKAYCLLKKEGLLALNVGNTTSWLAKILGKRWYIYIPPTHLHYFSKKGIEKLLPQRGFEIVQFKYYSKVVPLSLCFFRLSYIFDTSFTRWLYRFVENTRLGKLKIVINFRDVMTIFAMKK